MKNLARIRRYSVALALLLLVPARVNAASTVLVNSDAPWLGYMNVFELPSNGGGFAFGSAWGIADLTANFSGPILTLAPNTIGDPSSYWYTPSGGPGAVGNKTMDASLYVETTGLFTGQNLTFTGTVLNNTLTSSHSSVAFIKDFAPDYSSFVSVTVPLTPGAFNISLDTINDPARHVQYGFETIGPDVWVTDVGPYGSVQIAAVPEPSILVFAMGGMGLLFWGKRNQASSSLQK